MKSFLVFILTFISTCALANKQQMLRETMQDYLNALGSADEAQIKKITSESYLIKLKEKDALQRVFAKNKNFKKGHVNFDLIYKHGAKNKETIYVNIKPKEAKEYSDYWYVLKMENNRYVISDMRYWD